MILHAISTGMAFTAFYFIFFKEKINFSKKTLFLFLTFALMNYSYIAFPKIPGFMISTFEPILTIGVLGLITKKKYYDLFINRIAMLLFLLPIEIILILILYAFDAIYLAEEYGYHFGTAVYPLIIPLSLLFKKPMYSVADKLLNINNKPKEKNIIVIMMLHLSFVITKFVLSDYYDLTGDFFININTGIIIVVTFYFLAILAVSIMYIKKNRISAKERLEKIASENKKEILASTYSAIHDAKNVIQSIYFQSENKEIFSDISSSKLFKALLFSKMDLAKDNDIELVIKKSSEQIMDFSDENINELDFTIIFGILVDNAIEHLKSHKNLIQEISVTLNSNLTLSIENAVDESAIDNIHLFESFGYSSKIDSEQSGYGLYNAKNLAAKNSFKLDMTNNDSQIVFNLMST